MPHVNRALAALPDTVLVNGYGPTENTTFTTCHPLHDPADVTTPVPLGRPIHGTSVYVVDGTVRIEFGPGGARTADAGPGDFVHIPKHVVHRESNRGSTPSQEIVTRSGTGPLTVNVDDPAPPLR